MMIRREKIIGDVVEIGDELFVWRTWGNKLEWWKLASNTDDTLVLISDRVLHVDLEHEFGEADDPNTANH